MKLPKPFGRKKSQTLGADDDLFDDDDDALLNEESPASDIDEPADDEFGDDDDLQLGAPDAHRRTGLLIAGAALAVVLVVSGGAWWILGTDTPESANGELPLHNTPTHVILAVAPRPEAEPAASVAPVDEMPPGSDDTGPAGALSPGHGTTVVAKPVVEDAYKGIPRAPQGSPLPEAPDPALIESSPVGPLPKVSDDGRMPWQVYSRPFKMSDGTPLVALVFTGLGLNGKTTEAAITYLPPEVTLAFDPYGSDLDRWIAIARKDGHEALIELPLEPDNFPTRDPGPLALVTASSTSENIQRLNFILSRMSGYTGVLTQMGSRFATEEEQMRPVLEILRTRGLMYVDARAAPEVPGLQIAKRSGQPWGFVDLVLDSPPSQAAINRQLAQLERLARENGVAIAIAHPYPISISRISAWISSLGKQQIVLAPVSAIANRQRLP